MPWPDESLCERWIDWSWYQNHGGLTNRPFDVDAFCAAHPDIQGIIIRACWPDGRVDQHYAHYYDGFARNGLKVAAYLWPNPQQTIATVTSNWRRAIGDRVPRLIGYDYEEAYTFVGAPNSLVTSCLRASWEAAQLTFPGSVPLNYSRGSWLDARITGGTWMNDMRWWLAHYIYPRPDVAQTATSFEEIDARLPIDNGFTPARGRIITVDRVVAWQFTSRLMIVPNGTSDGHYLLKSSVREVYSVSPAPPPPEKIPVELRVPIGRTDVTVIET